MLLVHPPAAKPSEPPAGLARLSGTLKACGVPHEILDANVEGLLFLLETGALRPREGMDTWSRRALRNVRNNLAAVRDMRTYGAPDRYRRAVLDLNRAVAISAGTGAAVGLANSQRTDLSPLRSADLLRAAGHPESDPFYPYFRGRLEDLCGKSEPSIVGFSLNYLSQALTTFSMIGYLRKILPLTTIVVGGGLATSWMRSPSWTDPFRGLVDRLVAGPGETALLAIAGANAKEGVCHTPDYGGFGMERYLSPGPVIPYSASSGCYWNRCSFCPEKAEDNPYLPLAPEIVLGHLGSILPEAKPALLHLLDNAVSPALMEALVKDPPGVPWYGFSRFSRRLADPDFCLALRRSGCMMLKLGLESGDQDVLDRMQKGIDLAAASAALKALKTAGIATYVYLLFGTPEEEHSSARKTLDFVVRHKDEIGFLNIAVFNMPVNAVPVGIETSGFYEGDLSLYTDFVHPKGWDRKAVRNFLDREFKRDKAVSDILKKDPPIFTSNHAPFFCRSS